MPTKKIIFGLIILFTAYNFVFAEGLTSQQAIEYYNDGVKAQKTDNFFEAEVNYQKSLLVDPYNYNLRKYIINNRGIIFAKQGDLNAAEQAFNQALEMDPNYEPAKLNLGLIYEMRRSRLESLEYWSKVFDLDNLKPKGFVTEGQYSEQK